MSPLRDWYFVGTEFYSRQGLVLNLKKEKDAIYMSFVSGIAAPKEQPYSASEGFIHKSNPQEEEARKQAEKDRKALVAAAKKAQIDRDIQLNRELYL